MTKLQLIIIALSAINSAWPEEVTAKFKNVEQSVLDDIALKFEAELAEIQPTELEIRMNDFITATAPNVFIPLKTKLPSMDLCNKDSLAEIATNLVKALSFEEQPPIGATTPGAEAIGETAQATAWVNGDGVEMRGLPTFNSTPTAGEEAIGVKFNPNGITLSDFTHSRIANVVDALVDLSKIAENETQRANINNALFNAREFAKSVGVCFVV